MKVVCFVCNPKTSAQFHRAASAHKQNYVYQNKVTSQTTMSHVQLVTGVLLISA